jgi:hypothetical protein
MHSKTRSAFRCLAAAACATILCSGAALADPATPAPAATAPAPGMTHERLRAQMAQLHAEHVAAQLDRLAERLEIKASQEAAWQGFAAALRDLMTSPHALPPPEESAAQRDAATLAREHAQHAAEHAQKLARVADATAKLEQALGSDQRLVLDEAARHLADEHAGPPGMAHAGWQGREGGHCEGRHGHEGGRAEHGHGHDDEGEDEAAPHGPPPR